MEILITHCVEKEFKKVLHSQKSVNFFIRKIKQTDIEELYLKRPFVKIKVSIFWLALRVVWEYRKIEWRLVLILILKKSDKHYWYNLTWSKEIEHKVISMLPKISTDLKNLHYKIY